MSNNDSIFKKLYDAFLKILIGEDNDKKSPKGCLIIIAIALAALIAILIVFQSLPDYPNPAVTGLSFEIVESRMSSSKIRVVGIVQNVGPVPSKAVGNASLYRFDKQVKQTPLTSLDFLESIVVTYDVNESCLNADNGQYFFKIEYGLSGSTVPKDTDIDTSDNERELKGADICSELKTEFLSNYRNSLLALINAHRQNNQLQALVLDNCLNDAAQGHSEWMKQTGNFDHIGENGSKFYERCQDAGCTCSAENIYSGTGDPNGAFNAWKNSPGHNKHMLGPYTKIGIGILYGMVTAVFE
jgi:uncharacterized protein YkwD